MGALLSRFRKEQTTELKLEQLEEKIKKIEEYSANTQQRKKRFVGTFLAVAVGIYAVAFISIVYYVYFPVTWKERVLYIVPLLVSPYVIILLRRLFTWHYQRKLNKNAAMLQKLRAQKKEILEQVMDKETYKVAVNLLARFGDRGPNNRSLLGLNSRPPAVSPFNQSQSSMRSVVKPTTSQFGEISPIPANIPNRITIASKMPSLQSMAATSQLNSPSLSPAPAQGRNDMQLRRRTPFPIVNQAEKSILERCLDLLIGDGPQDRFAVICRECHSHNGMALKEEFDYIAYRCAFCNAMNPARKTRPKAPRLSASNAGTPQQQHQQSQLQSHVETLFLSPNGDSSNGTATPEPSDDEDDFARTRRRGQVRLTESTTNHDDPHVLRSASLAASVAAAIAAVKVEDPLATPPVVEDVSEPMDVEDVSEVMDVADKEIEVEEKIEQTQRSNVVSEEEKKTN